METEARIMCRAQDHSTPEPTAEPITEEKLEQLTRRWKEAEQIAEAQKQKQREKDDAEVRRLMAELEESRKLLPQEEIDWEEAIRESEDYYRGIKMYDWGAKEQSNHYEISQKYGSRIANEISRCRWDGVDIPKSLIAEMHRIHEGKPPRQKAKGSPVLRPAQKSGSPAITSQVNWDEIRARTSLEPKQYQNNQFSKVKAGLFNVARANKALRNPTILLLYLLQHRSWEGKKDKHDTYDTWYKKRKLIVASVGEDKICADFGVNEKTVRNWVNALHRSGVIKKLKDGKENVYVLGEVIDNKDLFYYSGEISWKTNSGSIH